MEQQQKKIIAVFGAVNSNGKYITPNVATRGNYKCPCCETQVVFADGKIKSRYFRHLKRTDECGAFSDNVKQIDKERLLRSRYFKDALGAEFIRQFEASEKVSVVYKCKNRDACLSGECNVLHSEIYNTEEMNVEIVKDNLNHSLYTIYDDDGEPIFNQVLYIGSIQDIHPNDAPVGYVEMKVVENINNGFIQDFFKTDNFQDTETKALQLITANEECDVCAENRVLFQQVVADKEYLEPVGSWGDVKSAIFSSFHLKRFDNNIMACLGFDRPHFDEFIIPCIFDDGWRGEKNYRRHELIKYFNNRIVWGNLKIDRNFNRSHFDENTTLEERRDSYNFEPYTLKKHPVRLVLDPNYFSNEYCEMFFTHKCDAFYWLDEIGFAKRQRKRLHPVSKQHQVLKTIVVPNVEIPAIPTPIVVVPLKKNNHINIKKREPKILEIKCCGEVVKYVIK